MGLLFGLFRVSVGGLILGGILAMAAQHLWPRLMVTPYEWVGNLLYMAGLL